MPSSKKAPKKPAKPASKGKPTPKKGTAPKKAPAAKEPRKARPPEPKPRIAPPPPPKAFAPVEDPAFVRKASPAERKAALEAILEAEGVEKGVPLVPPPPPATIPPFVREKSPLDRKAAVEQLVEESGVAGVLAKAPWKRSAPAPAPPPAPAPAEPAPRTSPKLQMTKAPPTAEVGRSPPRIVILDSNALMMQFQFHVDIEKEVRRILNFGFEIVVPRIVIDELERLAKEGNQKEAAEARMARQLAETFRIEDSPGDVESADSASRGPRRRLGEGDTGILRLAERLNAIVVTNDKVLRARLRAKDIPNIYMRSRAFLTIEGHIPGM